MSITLDHTIVPAKDKEASARFFADIMGLRFEGADRHFAPVRVNDTLRSCKLRTPHFLTVSHDACRSWVRGRIV
jgi:catechol 2,3-dioxygenase-like lactoylglutathione lyase family enzyme